jgi:hypothetical protein
MIGVAGKSEHGLHVAASPPRPGPPSEMGPTSPLASVPLVKSLGWELLPQAKKIPKAPRIPETSITLPRNDMFQG